MFTNRKGPERRTLQWIALATAVAETLLATQCNRQLPAPQARDASVLFITLDTTRADHLSCYAAEAVVPVSERDRKTPVTDRRYSRGARTPHLDALAARGIRFAHATAQVPLTLPSHACIMTGDYPPVHGLRDMGGFVL